MRNFSTIALAAFVLSILAGCATGNPVIPFMAKVFGRSAAAEAKNEAKTAAVEDKTVTAAQVEVVKTGVALAAAKREHPDSRPVSVAIRTNDNAAALLNQREALTAAQQQDAIATVTGLLSEERAARETAETAQRKTESENRQISVELAALREKAKQLAKDRAEEAARNLELANELRFARFMQYAGAAGSALLGLLAIAYRLNIGRLQTAAGEVLAHVKEAHGEKAADTARQVAGVVLHTGEQQGVFKVYSKLTS